jgi:anti-sigma regulatory factor (Ser/Thr protein kinase)
MSRRGDQSRVVLTEAPICSVVLSDARTARRWVRRQLEGRVAADDVERIEVVVSELVTNALVHVGGRAELSLRVIDCGSHGVQVDIDVTDAGAALDRPLIAALPADPWQLGGRGLAIVAELCAPPTVRLQPSGKTVSVSTVASAVEDSAA